jgi:hypothetical protein
MGTANVASGGGGAVEQQAICRLVRVCNKSLGKILIRRVARSNLVNYTTHRSNLSK